MPNKHAAQKDLRKNHRHEKANIRIKTNAKALFSKAVSLIKGGKKSEAEVAARIFQQAIDKAAKRNVFSVNASRRKKAALMKRLKTLSA